MNVHFESNVAEVVGVDGAIMLTNFQFWVNKNIANEKHFYEGTYWTYNTLEAYAKLFPFWSLKQVRRIIDNLEKDGYILKGNFNKKGYDRTTWYALTEKAWKLVDPYYEASNTNKCPNGQMDMPKRANGYAQMGTPIPYNNTDSNTYNIYSCWNNESIIIHKSLTKDMEKAINKALDKYTEVEILEAIQLYGKVLRSEYSFSYKWSLTDFLNRKNGISTFMDEGSNKINFEAWENKNKPAAAKNKKVVDESNFDNDLDDIYK